MCKKKLLNPPENNYAFWENKVMRKLGKKYEKYTYKELAELFGRTVGAIKARSCVLRIIVRMAPYADELLPVMKYKCSDSAKRRINTEEGRRTHSKAVKMAQNPEVKMKRSASFKAQLKTEQGKINLAKAHKAAQTQEANAKRAATMKAVWAKRKADNK